MRKNISLKDIAQKVGVSTALVSYVLNDKKTGRISKEIAAKIKATAIELNYRTNHIARSLKTNKTFTIGLVVADISNPFFSTLARIIEDKAESKGYSVLFGSSDESAEKSMKLSNLLLNHQVDGLIISPSDKGEAQIDYLQNIEIPFVLIDRYFINKRTNYIAIDNFKASYSITQHLLATERKRIGFVTFKSSLITITERKRGYLSALSEGGVQLDDRWIREVAINNSKVEVEQALDEMLQPEEQIDAVLFTTNTLSTHALKYLNTLPIEIPSDLAIASFDASDASDLFYAPVTHMKQPLQQMASMATDLLFEMMENKDLIKQINLEAELVVRKSTAKD